MKNKLITIFAVIGAVAAIAGGVAYLLKVKKELDIREEVVYNVLVASQQRVKQRPSATLKKIKNLQKKLDF